MKQERIIEIFKALIKPETILEVRPGVRADRTQLYYTSSIMSVNVDYEGGGCYNDFYELFDQPDTPENVVKRDALMAEVIDFMNEAKTSRVGALVLKYRIRLAEMELDNEVKRIAGEGLHWTPDHFDGLATEFAEELAR